MVKTNMLLFDCSQNYTLTITFSIIGENFNWTIIGIEIWLYQVKRVTKSIS